MQHRQNCERSVHHRVSIQTTPQEPGSVATITDSRTTKAVGDCLWLNWGDSAHSPLKLAYRKLKESSASREMDPAVRHLRLHNANRMNAWVKSGASGYCIEITTASPPKLSIRPVRLAFRCMMTPLSFLSHRSPVLALPITMPYRP
jgi:hypothetical protein